MEKRAISLEDEAGMSGFFVAGHIMMMWMLRWINININSMIGVAVGRWGCSGGGGCLNRNYIGAISAHTTHHHHQQHFHGPPCSSAYHSLAIKCRGRWVPNVQLHKCKHRWTHRLHWASGRLTHRYDQAKKFKILTNRTFNLIYSRAFLIFK